MGWGVEGRRYASGGETPRGPRRLLSRVCGPLGSGTAVEVAAEEVAWPRQPAAEVGGCTTSPWESRVTWRGPGNYPAGSVVWIGVKMPEAPPGGLRRVGGARRDGGGGRGGEAYICVAAACYAVPGVPRHEVRLCCRRGLVG